MYNTLSIIALCFEIILLGYVIFKTAKYKMPFTKKTLWYAVPVSILVYYMYVVGYIYANNGITAFEMLKMISTTLEAFVFKLNLDAILPLALANKWYFAAMFIALLFAGATLISSIIGIWGAKLKNKIRRNRAVKSGKEFVIGSSQSVLSYAQDNGAVVLSFDGKEKLKTLIEKRFTVFEADTKIVNKQLNKKFEKGKMYHFIAFADCGFSYVKIIEWFIRQFGGVSESYFSLHIEASLSEMDIINRKFIDTNQCDNICVKAFNKYELLARKFIMDYPLSSDIPESFYGKYRTIKPDKKINVVCLGFGKVNYELLKLMIMQNQFVGLNQDATKFVNSPVDYYIFDNSEDKICSDLLLKLKSDLNKLQNFELPKPEAICNIAKVKQTNVFSLEFADELQKILSDENAYTYVIVSIGNDYDNLIYAERLRDTYANGTAKCKIFARVKDEELLPAKCDDIVCFGNEKQILSRDVLVNDALDALARDLNNMYNTNSATEIENYNARPTIERYSNIYHITSIFFKMGLLGLKFVKSEQNDSTVRKEELFSLYDGFTKATDYEKYFDLNVWSMLGFSEHSRWVALYLLKGFRPMPYADIKVSDGNGIKITAKDLVNRRHCCLTDYYSLDQYHRHLLELYREKGAENTEINDVETYKYDYMFIGEAYDKMIAFGYSLVKRED